MTQEIVSRVKVPPAKISEKGYRDEHGEEGEVICLVWDRLCDSYG